MTTGVVVIVPSERLDAPEESALERALFERVASLLADHGIATVTLEPPCDPAEPTCRVEAIVTKQKRLLALFETVAARYRSVPQVVLAAGESAECVAALLRVGRPSTKDIVMLLLTGCTPPSRFGAHAAPPLVPARYLYRPAELREQVAATRLPMWREVVAEAYASQVRRDLAAQDERRLASG